MCEDVRLVPPANLLHVDDTSSADDLSENVVPTNLLHVDDRPTIIRPQIPCGLILSSPGARIAGCIRIV